MNRIFFILCSLVLASTQANAGNLNLSRVLQPESVKTLCGADDRIASDVNEIGRIVQKINDDGGCSGTLIGKSCFITAGHCADSSTGNPDDYYFNYVQFNVPHKGAFTNANNLYAVDQKTVYVGSQSDWAIGQLLPNSSTGKKAGDVQGHLTVSTQSVSKGMKFSITGYGETDGGQVPTYYQQAAVGTAFSPMQQDFTFEYQVDTMPGDSGASVIDVASGEVIGIHTNGGCSQAHGNFGTAIVGNPELQQAIVNCLANDK